MSESDEGIVFTVPRSADATIAYQCYCLTRLGALLPVQFDGASLRAHYASMRIDRPAWEPPAAGEYAKVRPALEALLTDEVQRSLLSVEAARYFEEHACPEAVARYILDAVREEAPA